jgi:hypothetical protein
VVEIGLSRRQKELAESLHQYYYFLRVWAACGESLSIVLRFVAKLLP